MADSRSKPEASSEGTMVVVVGPSGAGKDTLIDYIRKMLSGRSEIHFVKRTITRPAEAGGEDHTPATEAEFSALRAAGSFCVDWQAHGLHYGIPSAVCDVLRGGGLAIANGSRSALPHFSAAFPNLLVVNIVAKPEVLAERLKTRGRESENDIAARLRRSEEFTIPPGYRCVTIDNSGDLKDAGEAFLSVLTAMSLETSTN
ncbi:phosphonate metabolism protein/1,5-bisphosphokinase (PRPP-forming) PhnN [Rhizobium sp. SL86]|uniref:phosphonate metabolism protein/1,5-bisphosphokinase (PRPP-forming) PhnN n=1 Tax=Rhizobium sp. SL86 TaxID=2995148 RepID=UPI00227415E3|nr:phosphonate metabolism protein/1,5-bisphosphokinase (PRPP-forming) PhnN [Rhizobium sp. SL86]MCY1666402.1 phosphonate metabolism protein/1,5-bisphosphokinase (PRPP-forming) PhnN [Rhizobium sp. SL86]